MSQNLKQMPDIYWKDKLNSKQYNVLRLRATEAPFSGELLHNKANGMYVCAACKNELFSSETKFDSGSGWPSFYDALDKNKVELREDKSHGMIRTEVICAKCGGHLGHLFEDGPQDKTGLRYCINSCSLNFKKKEND